MDLLSNQKETGFCVYLEMGNAEQVQPIEQWLKDCADLSQVSAAEQSHLQVWDWAAFEYHKQLGDPLPKDLVVIEKQYHISKEQSVLMQGAQFFTYPEDIDLLLLRLSVHIQQVSYLRALEGLSVSDYLTGLFNRRKYDQDLDKTWRQGKRQESPCSLLLVDVDYFKRFNDTYGHLSGDECLRELATIFKACAVRPHDVVARIGGEEFAVILPDTPLQGAKFVAKQILKAVLDKNIRNENTPLGRISVSIGIACVQPRTMNKLSEWQQAADDALYKAKSSGRNQLQFNEQALPLAQAEVF